ncbi:MAG: protein kinase [Nocardioidaceae bacterium]|nr:protein kinase [Nocardioidaceae bacterium]
MQGIADYEFVQMIGESNYGENYLARTPDRLQVPDEHVVVKVISGPTSEDAYRRATRELKHFSLARSDKLVSLYDVGRQGGTFYHVMEHLPLGSLQRPTRQLSRTESTRAVAHAAEAAHALHERGIAHRDIKPANIMLHEGGGKLSDLGLSQLLSPGMVFTGLGQIGLEFTDPAILVGAEASRATDIWSLGATLHYALTGSSVYGELPTNEPLLLVRAILAAAPAISSHLDAESAAVISRCLDADLSQRPGTAAELATQISALS